MRTVLRKPLFWLAVQVFLVFAYLQSGRRFREVQRTPDSGGYEDADLSSLAQALSSIRTLGYPLFLKGVGWLAPSLAALPACQFAVHIVAVLLFYLGLRCIALPGWL